MSTLPSDLKTLTLNELYAIKKHVTQHELQAIVLGDKDAEDNARWLLNQVKYELRNRL